MADKDDFKEKQSLLSKRVLNLKNKATEAEIILMKKFSDLGIRAMFQKGFIKGKNFCIVDFYLPAKKLCVEVDGGYHLDEKQIKRDISRTWYLTEIRKLRVLRLTNEEAISISLEDLAQRL